MNVIVCLDPKNGMQFHHRRQSQDARQRQDVKQMVQGQPLYMRAKSYALYRDVDEGNIIVDEQGLEHASAGEWCLVEEEALQPYTARIERLVVYRWNHVYPSDRYFDLDVTKWTRLETIVLRGRSHEAIQKEVYRKGETA